MKLSQLRDFFAELKVNLSRAQSYFGVLNFLLIFAVFLNTTAYEYDVFQNFFPSKKVFMLVGLAIILVVIFVIAKLDTRYKIWAAEVMRTMMPGRHPNFIPHAFQSAKMLNEIKARSKNKEAVTKLEARLDDLYKQCGLDKEFEFFKESTKLK
jgi:hypothetical protein